MNYTDKNVMVVAQKIVDDMDLDDLMSYVYDDLCAIMDKDEELFNSNVDHFEMNENISGRSKWGIQFKYTRIMIIHNTIRF